MVLTKSSLKRHRQRTQWKYWISITILQANQANHIEDTAKLNHLTVLTASMTSAQSITNEWDETLAQTFITLWSIPSEDCSIELSFALYWVKRLYLGHFTIQYSQISVTSNIHKMTKHTLPFYEISFCQCIVSLACCWYHFIKWL